MSSFLQRKEETRYGCKCKIGGEVKVLTSVQVKAMFEEIKTNSKIKSKAKISK
jgi:hypothetical protein